MNTIINCETGEVTVRPYTAAEQAEFDAAQKAWADGATDRAWADLRWQRNKLLTETDWMANSDYTMSDPWKTYRQALRDLPANTSDPANPTWPEEPSQ